MVVSSPSCIQNPRESPFLSLFPLIDDCQDADYELERRWAVHNSQSHS